MKSHADDKDSKTTAKENVQVAVISMPVEGTKHTTDCTEPNK